MGFKTKKTEVAFHILHKKYMYVVNTTLYLITHGINSDCSIPIFETILLFSI